MTSMVTYRHIWMLLNVFEFLLEGDTPSDPRMQGRSKVSHGCENPIKAICP